MSLLSQIKGPEDLKSLSYDELATLAQEIRDFLVESVSRTGGHLGPNLGVVELTIALHRVFDSPRDVLLFDTGHQSYVHKLLTDRKDFQALRRKGGLSGYPSRGESEHDVVENSHASTSLAWADGIARAHQIQGRTDRHVVAVIGDGALTGGMAWESLNNIAMDQSRRVIIVVNDNGRSYAPTIGGVANHLDVLRTTQGYERFLAMGKRTLRRGGRLGKFVYSALHGLKKGIKDLVAPQGLFEDLGLKYIGPVDGHDAAQLEQALARARMYQGPVIVHAITEKGRGFVPAETDQADRFHAVGIIHPETGLPVAPSRFGWTSVFADELVKIGRERPDVVALTAAMLQPVGLSPFQREFPDRVIDVGIAEQHAVTAAAGLAYAGMHPVFAVYATFLNRAFDQVLMDAGLHRAGVTIMLDRAGVTGDDGPSHNGMWDMALMQVVPGLRMAAPRDAAMLRQVLREAVDVNDAPTVIRYPKGAVWEDIPAVESHGVVDILSASNTDQGEAQPLPDETSAASATVLILGVGSMVPTALDVAERLRAHGLRATVADARWIYPVPAELLALAGEHGHVVTIEDGLIDGGVGASVSQALREQQCYVPVQSFGVPKAYLAHAYRSEILDEIGLTAQDIARGVVETVVAQAPSSDTEIRF